MDRLTHYGGRRPSGLCELWPITSTSELSQIPDLRGTGLAEARRQRRRG